MRIKKARHELIKDMLFVLIGIVVAIILSRLGFIDYLVNMVSNQIIISFIAGVFFTSVFTIAPAAVALVDIADASVMTVAFYGSLGALCGDLILF